MESKIFNSATEHFFLNTKALDKPLLVGANESITYRNIYDKIARLAAGLSKKPGAQPERIILLSDNSEFFIAACYAIIGSGHACVPLDPKSSIEQVRYVKDTCETKTAFIQTKFAEKFGSLFSQVSTEDNLEQVSASQQQKMEVASQDDTALILFTSGSTGTPKGVMLTHANLISNAQGILKSLPVLRDDILELVLPLYYSFGFSALNTHVMTGASIHINNKFMFPTSVGKDIETLGCTSFYGVPSHFQILARNTDFLKRSFPTLRYMAQAGGKLPTAVIEEYLAKPAGAPLYIMYGATEATARITCLNSNDLRKKMGSVGKPLENLQIRLDNGEVLVKGPSVMKGYFKDPQGTAAVLNDGWLRTGDLARQDDEGYITIVDRERDFIKAGGYRVSSKEIEDVIMTDPRVLEAAVVGVPDELMGEAVKAYISFKDKSLKECDERLKEICRDKLLPHKIPKYFVVMDELPKGSSGKVLKPTLRAKG